MQNLEDLRAFIRTEMKMSDIYQPVIIKYMLLKNSPVSKRELAIQLLENDSSQVRYYERILMRWPKTTLEKHNFFRYDKSTHQFIITFPINKNDELLVRDILQLCEDKINTWNKKEYSIPKSLRYEMLKRANHKCELCGITADITPLDVDHIVPQSTADKNGRVFKDGVWMNKDDERNLQVLCATCNRGKHDSDDTDFRPKFQKLIRDKVIEEIIETGGKPEYVELNGESLVKALYEKLREEYVEFLNSKKENEKIDELVDIYEVIKAILKSLNCDEIKFHNLVDAKKNAKGGFDKALFLKKR